MFSNKIEFFIHPDLVEVKEIQPKSAKKFIPEWYKKIPTHSFPKLNIKGCMPFLDCITAGYTLPLPQDLNLNFNFYNEELKEYGIRFHYGASRSYTNDELFKYNLNSNASSEHHIEQLGGRNSFPVEKNGKFNFLKILNPWIIKTPPGYSCLFMPPVLNENDYFSIIPGIVDTDKYSNFVNFPILINADKYPKFNKLFKQGMPYVQIIPFKRESWQSEIKSINNNLIKQKFQNLGSLINSYKEKIWLRKKWS